MNDRRWFLQHAAASVLLLGGCATRTSPAAWPDTASLLRRVGPAVLGVGDAHGVNGSGFRLAGTDTVVTAAHVLDGLRAPPCVRWNGTLWPVRLRASDPAADLALLDLSKECPAPGLALAEAGAVEIGDWVLVLGCPFGTAPTATLGIVSALPGAVLQPPELARRLQLNAAINPGNSGGPVVNLSGAVVAVANATLPGGYGLGFGVPVGELRRLASAAPFISRTDPGS